MDIAAAKKLCEAASPAPWFPGTVLHLALVSDIEFVCQAREGWPAALEALENSESARETLAELHESIASQLEAAGYVTPTPVAVEQLLEALEEAQGKLKALREDAKKVQDAGPSKDDQWWIDRILRGSKEDE